MNIKESKYNGILLVDKPSGISSHDLVDEIRKIIKQKRVGHTGTLDQRACGLMIICLGKGTKVAQFITDFGKSYKADITLGKRSKTFDTEGIFDEMQPLDVPELNDSEIEKLLLEFTGHIQQKVPVYSAVRVDGNRLYKMARQGIDVEPPTREVHIERIDLLDYSKPVMSIHVTCSKGTYIRSLANDIGNRLGCGGYLSKLIRFSIGDMSIDDALTLEDIKILHQQKKLENYFIPLDELLNFGSFKIVENFIKGVFNGKQIKTHHVDSIEGEFKAGDSITLKDPSGNILAVGVSEIDSDGIEEIENSDKIFKYTRVLN